MAKRKLRFGFGDKVEHVITDKQYYVHAITEYFTGCIHYGVKDFDDEEDITWFDSQWLALVEEEYITREPARVKRFYPSNHSEAGIEK